MQVDGPPVERCEPGITHRLHRRVTDQDDSHSTSIPQCIESLDERPPVAQRPIEPAMETHESTIRPVARVVAVANVLVAQTLRARQGVEHIRLVLVLALDQLIESTQQIIPGICRWQDCEILGDGA